MKRFICHSLLVSIILFISPASAASAESVVTYERKIQFERDVVRQIKDELTRFLPSDDHEVIASAHFETVRKARSSHVMENSAGGTAVAADLPGFQKLGPASSPRSTSVLYEEITELRSLKITFYHGSKITPDALQRVRDYLNERWVAPNPSIIQAEIKKTEWPSSGKKNLSSSPLTIGEILIVVICIALFIAAILTFISRRKDDRIPLRQEAPGGNGNRALHPGVGEPPLALHQLKELFVHEFMEQPFFSRGFLQTLPVALQTQVCSFFKNSFIRDFISRCLKSEVTEPITEFSVEVEDLQILLGEIRGYKKVRAIQFKMPFGFLSDLTDDEIRQLLQGESLETLALVAPYLLQEQVNHLLQSLNMDQQTTLIQMVKSDHIYADGVAASIESRLRIKYQELMHRMIHTGRSSQAVVEMILETSPYSAALAQKLESADPGNSGVYRKFKLGFEDLLTQEKSVLKKVLGELDNDILLPFLQSLGSEERERICWGLSKERIRTLEGLTRSRGDTFTPEARIRSRQFVLRKMRELLRDQIH